MLRNLSGTPKFSDRTGRGRDTVATMTDYSASREFKIDQEIEIIVAKLAAGTATDNEKAALAQLSARRARMMRRSIHPRQLSHAAA